MQEADAIANLLRPSTSRQAATLPALQHKTMAAAIVAHDATQPGLQSLPHAIGRAAPR
jgi:hypothetical protein